MSIPIDEIQAQQVAYLEPTILGWIKDDIQLCQRLKV